MNDLQIIPLRNNLLIDFTYNDIKVKVINRLIELNLNQSKYKNDAEFLNLVCNLIEHLVKKSDKINKEQLVITIYCEIFQTSEEEKERKAKIIVEKETKEECEKTGGEKTTAAEEE